MKHKCLSWPRGEKLFCNKKVLFFDKFKYNFYYNFVFIKTEHKIKSQL